MCVSNLMIYVDVAIPLTRPNGLRWRAQHEYSLVQLQVQPELVIECANECIGPIVVAMHGACLQLLLV